MKNIILSILILHSLDIWSQKDSVLHVKVIQFDTNLSSILLLFDSSITHNPTTRTYKYLWTKSKYLIKSNNIHVGDSVNAEVELYGPDLEFIYDDDTLSIRGHARPHPEIVIYDPIDRKLDKLGLIPEHTKSRSVYSYYYIKRVIKTRAP